jgi:hypothetical protein
MKERERERVRARDSASTKKKKKSSLFLANVSGFYVYQFFSLFGDFHSIIEANRCVYKEVGIKITFCER